MTITSSTSQVCSVDADGTDVVALMAGACTLVASQEGDETRAAAEPVTVSSTSRRPTRRSSSVPVDDLKVNAGPPTSTSHLS